MMSKYIVSKLDNKKYCISNGKFTRHLLDNNLTNKDYYEIYETGVVLLCSCLKPLTYYSNNNTYGKTCGNPKCIGKETSNTKKSWSDEQVKSFLAKRDKSREQWSIEHKKSILAKTQQTNLKKYGDINYRKTEDFKIKAKQTKLQKYGNEYYCNQKQALATRHNKSDCEKQQIIEKRQQTNLKKYGVECVLDLVDRNKILLSNKTYKSYIKPDDVEIKIKGYENKALDILFYEYKFDIAEILINYEGNIPKFNYISNDGRKRTYYPDILIKSLNKIIEVKSYWWFDGYQQPNMQGRLFNNIQKMKSVLTENYDFEFWIWNSLERKFDEYDYDKIIKKYKI